MAIVEVKVPQLSESVAEATLLQWKKKVGDAVAVDEILIDVETDKVVLEVPAPSAGVIVEIIQPDGSTVAADQLIARIDTEGVAGGVAPVAPVVAAMAAAAAVPVAAPVVSASMAGVPNSRTGSATRSRRGSPIFKISRTLIWYFAPCVTGRGTGGTARRFPDA